MCIRDRKYPVPSDPERLSGLIHIFHNHPISVDLSADIDDKKSVIVPCLHSFEQLQERTKNHGRKNHRTHRTYWTDGLPDPSFQLTGNEMCIRDRNKPENVDAYAETSKPVLFLPFPSEIPVIFPLYLHHKAFPEFLFE